MTAAELKASILDLAIRGKLVAQDPNAEPASELLARIAGEKAKLIKEKKIKKSKPLDPIVEDEIPFEIPDGWVWCRLGNVCMSIQYGYNAPAKPEGRIMMVRISDIQNGVVCWDGVPYCEIKESDIPDYLLQPNDILFARTGGTVGKSYIVDVVPHEAIYAGYLIRTRYSADVCAKYFKLFMESTLYWEQLRDGTIATAQPNCNGQTLSKMMIPLPPLAEQKRIVEKVEELMPLVERYEKAEAKRIELEKALPGDLEKSILQVAIQGKLVEQDPNDEPASELLARIAAEKVKLIKEKKIKKEKPLDPIDESEVPFALPKGWAWCRLGDVCVYSFVGKSPKYSKTPNKNFTLGQRNNQDYGIDFAHIKYSTDDFIRDYPEIMYLKDWDVLLNTLGGGTIGRVGLFKVRDNERFITDGHLFVFRFVNIETAQYLYYWFKTQRQRIEEESDGSTNQTFLKLPKVNEYLIPVPPLAEQKRIVAKVDELLGALKRLH